MQISLAQSFHSAFTHIAPPVADLVNAAAERLLRQKQYAHLLAKGGKKAATLHEWMDQATDCVGTLARPLAIFRDIPTQTQADHVIIADRVRLHDTRVLADIAGGCKLGASLYTLGYDQDAAFDWLQKDYGVHHIQSALARETLFALARAADQAKRDTAPDKRLVRVAVQADAPCGERRLWEPAQVQTIMGLFDDVEHPVSVTESGCFQPIHSMLSLTYLR